MEKFYTVQEVANMYRYTKDTVWKKCRQYQDGSPNGWPHHRDGKIIRFTEGHLSEIKSLMNPTPAAPPRKKKREPLTVKP